ncbi:MAG: ribosome-binding factor A [Candidatus Moranbacteria bacterium]|nr:ribosome-binding factor A [Candidatus Moranbacteria bacterium]
MSHRILQINGLIRELLGEILLREVNFKPGVLATISKVDTSPDLRNSRVYISVLPENEFNYVLKTLRYERKRIQHELHGKLQMKPMPKISFEYDPTESRADTVEKILKIIDAESE